MPPKTESTAQPKGNQGKAPKQEKKPNSVGVKPKESGTTVEQVRIEQLSVSESKPASIPSNGEKSAVDMEKKIKGLRKKLRDIEELAKKDHSQLNSEQVEKLNKKDTLEQELRELEEKLKV